MMAFGRSLRSFGRRLLYSSVVLIPVVVPLFFLAQYRDRQRKARSDMAVVVSKDALDTEFNRFHPRRCFSVGAYLGEMSDFKPENGTFRANLILWARNVFDRSRNDRSMLDLNELTVVNANSQSVSTRVVRKVDENDRASPFLSYVSYEIRGEFQNDLNLHRYPFDRHLLRLTVAPRTLQAHDLLLSVDPGSLVNGNIRPGDWDVAAFRGWSEVQVAKTDFSDPEVIRKGELWNYLPQVTFELEVRRRVVNHLLKRLLPLLVILLVVYSGLFLGAKDVGARRGAAIMGLLTVTALYVATATSLPGVNYMTAVDGFFAVAFSLMVMVTLEPLITQRLLPAEMKGEEPPPKPHAWIRIGLPALRVLYPLILAGGWYGVALRAMA